MAKGETAGLLQQLPEASDAFSTSLGNIPAGEKVLVTITYVSELKHDAEVDGIRWTLPTKIAPPYGNEPLDLTQRGPTGPEEEDGISITVDVDVGDSSTIQSLQSPSHPIGVTMGKTSASSAGDLVMHKASATLALGTTQLDDSLAEAIKHVECFGANLGGTETFAALKAAVENRYTDLHCEIMLLTDGDM